MTAGRFVVVRWSASWATQGMGKRGIATESREPVGKHPTTQGRYQSSRAATQYLPDVRVALTPAHHPSVEEQIWPGEVEAAGRAIAWWMGYENHCPPKNSESVPVGPGSQPTGRNRPGGSPIISARSAGDGTRQRSPRHSRDRSSYAVGGNLLWSASNLSAAAGVAWDTLSVGCRNSRVKVCIAPLPCEPPPHQLHWTKE